MAFYRRIVADAEARAIVIATELTQLAQDTILPGVLAGFDTQVGAAHARPTTGLSSRRRKTSRFPRGSDVSKRSQKDLQRIEMYRNGLDGWP